MLLFVARPKTFALGHIPDSSIYRSIDQYQNVKTVPGILILQIDAPIYFANAGYLRERYNYSAHRVKMFKKKRTLERFFKFKFSLFLRISRWVNEEEDRLKSAGEDSLQYVILALSGK